LGARSYAQFCGLARALDVVGERWTLLVVRELLIGPARYGELAAALPGVASNLLADRLRTLVASGVVERRLDDAGGHVVYALTPWGEGLREAVEALVRWSAPLMAPGPADDAFDARWLSVALRALLHGRRSRSRVAVGVETAGATLLVQVGRDGTVVTLDPEALPPTVLRADPDVVLGLAAGALPLEDALERGELEGDRGALAAVFPGRTTS
jgi:DNA-binding HxlR family transcriptional regulator